MPIKRWLVSMAATLLFVAMSAHASDWPTMAELGDDAMVLAVDDPRSQLRRAGLPNTAYGRRFAYENDPALDRLRRRLVEQYDLTVSHAWPIASLDVHCMIVTGLSDAVAQRFASDARVRWLQPLNSFRVRGVSRSHGIAPPTSSGAAHVHSGAGRRVAVIDTGAAISHPAFRHAQIRYVDVIDDASTGQHELHGTLVLGVLAAEPGMAIEAGANVAGIAKDAQLHHVRGCWEHDGKGRCNTLSLALALDEVLMHPPDVLNLSLSGPADPLLEALVARLASTGTTVVAAYDEDRAPHQRFPAPAEHVVYAVADTAPDMTHDALAARVVRAPGRAISTSPEGGFDLAVGHSIAAPHVAGMLATGQLPDGEAATP